MAKHKVLIIGDTHIGSIWGLSTPKFLLKGGNTVEYNEVQEHLWKNWLLFTSEVAKRKIDTLVLNGDMVDGPAPKDRGRNLMSSEMTDQTTNAAMILEQFVEDVKPKQVIMLSGTDYHDNVQQDNELELSKYINAQYVGLGPFDFKFGGVNVNISHGSGSSYWYRGTKMDKVGFSMQLNIAGDGLYDARYIVQSHLHFSGYLRYPHQSVFVVGCWQAQTNYMRSKDPFKMVPNIGSLELDVEDGRVTPVFYEYTHPPRPHYVINGVALIERNLPTLPPGGRTEKLAERMRPLPPV